MTILAILLLTAVGPARAADKPASSCVDCHRGLAPSETLAHTFSDWEGSKHAQAGVACQDCHKGDPAAKDEKAAHKGMLRSGDARSSVYFTNIPATCGACHQAEFSDFKKSAHFRELKASGRGPNCVTCHGAMANHILTPRELETVCTVCHRKPVSAQATLMSLGTSKKAVERLAEAVARAKEKGLDAGAQVKELEAVRGEQREALEEWHTFKMNAVLRRSQQIIHRCDTAISELKVKGLE
ncbi:MAG: hypothetical protein KGL53_06965 [Elusimicrobia bacterium]|nr:hypothetical protein [Elusimicrobiota bacterium]